VRRLVPVVALVGLLLAACGGNSSTLDSTSWDYFAYDIGDGVVEVLPGTQPTVTFEGDVVSGSDGCNDFTGSYEISSGNMIEIGPLASTQKACEADVMAQADVILSIMGDAFLYQKTTDSELFIRTESARFAGYAEHHDE